MEQRFSVKRVVIRVFAAACLAAPMLTAQQIALTPRAVTDINATNVTATAGVGEITIRLVDGATTYTGTIKVSLNSPQAETPCKGNNSQPCLSDFRMRITHNFTGIRDITIIGPCVVDNVPGTSRALPDFTCPHQENVRSTPFIAQGFVVTLFTGGFGVSGSVRFTVNWQSSPATGCIAPTANGTKPGGPLFAVACSNAISIDTFFPKATDNPIAALADELPGFCAYGTYSLVPGKQARISLLLRDEQSRILARNDAFYLFEPDDKKPWGGGCADKKAWIVIREKSIDLLRKQGLWPSKFELPKVFSGNSDQVLGQLFLSAALVDFTTGAPIVESTPIPYDVVPGIKLRSASLILTNSFQKTRDVLPPTKALPSAELKIDGSLQPTLSFTSSVAFALGYSPSSRQKLELEAEIDFPAESGQLSADFLALDYLNRPIPAKLTATTAPLMRGRQTVSVTITGQLPENATTISVIPTVEINYTQKLLLTPLTTTINLLLVSGIAPDPAHCSFNDRSGCLVSSKENKVTSQLLVVPAGSNTTRVQQQNFQTSGNQREGGPVTPIKVEGLQPGKPTPVTHETTVGPIPAGVSSVDVTYALICGTLCAGSLERFESFLSADVMIGGAAFDTLDKLNFGALRKIKKLAPLSISAIRKAVDYYDVYQQLSKIRPSQAPLDRAATTEPAPHADAAKPDVILLRDSWQFSPTIPRDGSFSAQLALRYTDDQFPSDPNFAEGKIQIISLDPAGALRVYPTTLDVVTNEATAEIDSLDPFYALAIVGPFTQPAVLLASVRSGYALVNAGTQPATLKLANPSSDGEGLMETVTLNSLNQRRTDSTSEGWLKSWADSASVAGALFDESGRTLAVAASSKAGTLFVFPHVEQASRRTTEFHWANPSQDEATIVVTLYKPDGSRQDAATTTLEPSHAERPSLKGLFPALADGFQGYAVISSTRPIVAGGLLKISGFMGSLVAQPIDDTTLAVTSRFAPVVSDTAGASVYLVNLGKSNASVTLRARTAAGAAAGPDVRIPLSAGSQYSQPLDDIFTAGKPASLEVISSAPGVFGDLVSADSAFLSQYTASLPLTGEPSANAVLPYATSSTVVSVFNSGTGAAAVTITAYSPTGAAGASSNSNVAPGGRALINAPSNGFVIVRSTQPVVAAGLVSSTSGGGIAGYPAIPVGATASGGGGTGPRPTASSAGVLNAASFKGGGVSPGEIVTIFGTNVGPPSIAGLTLTDGRVATALSDTRVLFDGVPAPLIYVLATQSSAIVPYSVAGKSSTQMVIEYQGQRSDPVTIPVALAAPGLFSANSSGTGPGAILNQDSKVNTPSNPAAKGSVIILFGTGEGAVDPAVPDGNVNSAVFPKPRQPVTVTIGGSPAEILYSGAAPGLIAGVLQVNVRVPANVGGGNQPVIVNVGGNTSQAGLTVAVEGAPAATPPAISASTTPLAFGTVGTPQTKDVQVSNTGDAALNVTASVTGTGFSLVTASSFTIQPKGAAQTVTVRYTPTAGVSATGTLTLTSNDPAKRSIAISLTGTGAVSGGGLTTLVCNGSFEQPGNVTNSFSTIAVGGNLPCWSVTANSVDYIGGTYWQHSNGQFSLDMDGNAPAGPGTIAQTFATVPGTTYTVTFDMATNTGSSGTKQLQVSAAGKSEVKSLSTTGRSNANMGWTPQTFSFTASAVSTTLEFKSLSAAGSPYGAALDNVCVVAPGGTCTVTGGGTTDPSVITVDDGTFEQVIGYPAGGVTSTFVNRLTPSRYPATLRAVQIFFPQGELPVNTNITIRSGTNPNGTGPDPLTGITLQSTNAQITSVQQFVEYAVTPITIQSGDFVVGFSVTNPATIYPASVDNTSTLQRRSYISSDAVTFRLIDSVGLPGNLGIRAKVDLGTDPGGGGGGTSGCIGTSPTAGLPARPTCAVLDPSNPLATNLAGLFIMNEGSGTTTKNLVTNQNAALSGPLPPTWNTSDPSLVFRGGEKLNSYVNAGTGAEFDRMPVSRFTVVAKVNVTALAAMGLAEKNDGNAADGFLFELDADGNPVLIVEKSSQDLNVVGVGAALKAGQWAQVAVTWDGTVGTPSAVKLFVNGVELQSSVKASGAGQLGFAGATNQPFRIGSAGLNGHNALNGKMAYLAVYNGRLLTAAELTQLDSRLPLK